MLSTDDVRRELQRSGVISGQPGSLDDGLYTPENVAIVYDEVSRRARQLLANGRSTILDGTWRDSRQRDRARELARAMAAPISEFTCSVPTSVASERIENRPPSASDATPQIAVALADRNNEPLDGYRVDTGRPLFESVADVRRHI